MAEKQDCRCDCVNCVTGNHGGCYYSPVCELARQTENKEQTVKLDRMIRSADYTRKDL